jgi:hypothetical protein
MEERKRVEMSSNYGRESLAKVKREKKKDEDALSARTSMGSSVIFESLPTSLRGILLFFPLLDLRGFFLTGSSSSSEGGGGQSEVNFASSRLRVP